MLLFYPIPRIIRMHSHERTHPNYINVNRKKAKHQTIDVYRSLSRVDSRTSPTHAVDRNTTNEELMLLANSFVIDHLSSSPTSGYFHPQNLPNIQKHRLNNNNRSKSRNAPASTFRFQQQIGPTKPTPVDIHYNETKQTTRSNRIGTSHTKSSSSSSSSSNFSSRSQRVLRAKPTPPEQIHRTTPVDTTYNDEDSEITTATVNYSPLPNSQTRKQLHVYMPQIISC